MKLCKFRLRKGNIHANLVDDEGRLVISATLNYILTEARKREYVINNSLEALNEIAQVLDR